MKDKAPEQERFKIMEWVRDGALIEDYKDDGIDKIIESRCVMCHNESASGIPDFTKFEQLKILTAQDTGATFSSLIRVSHIHLFGISFIFMFVGLIFSFAETTTTQYKCIAIGMPYGFLIADILSWWLTKIHPMFAWLVILAGMGMAVSFVFMWATSILEMWFFKPVFIDGIGSRYLQWRDSLETSVADKLWFYIKELAKQVKLTAAFVTEQWLTRGWPIVKEWFKKIS
jgi:hypothetical protein